MTPLSPVAQIMKGGPTSTYVGAAVPFLAPKVITAAPNMGRRTFLKGLLLAGATNPGQVVARGTVNTTGVGVKTLANFV
jgi:hypothetical protein